MLAGARQGMPAAAFEAALGIAQRTLAPKDHAQLMHALGLPAVPGLMTA
jgi:hypothetical protein